MPYCRCMYTGRSHLAPTRHYPTPIVTTSPINACLTACMYMCVMRGAVEITPSLSLGQPTCRERQCVTERCTTNEWCAWMMLGACRWAVRIQGIRRSQEPLQLGLQGADGCRMRVGGRIISTTHLSDSVAADHLGPEGHTEARKPAVCALTQ